MQFKIGGCERTVRGVLDKKGKKQESNLPKESNPIACWGEVWNVHPSKRDLAEGKPSLGMIK